MAPLAGCGLCAVLGGVERRVGSENVMMRIHIRNQKYIMNNSRVLLKTHLENIDSDLNLCVG